MRLVAASSFFHENRECTAGLLPRPFFRGGTVGKKGLGLRLVAASSFSHENREWQRSKVLHLGAFIQCMNVVIS